MYLTALVFDGLMAFAVLSKVYFKVFRFLDGMFYFLFTEECRNASNRR